MIIHVQKEVLPESLVNALQAVIDAGAQVVTVVHQPSAFGSPDSYDVYYATQTKEPVSFEE